MDTLSRRSRAAQARAVPVLVALATTATGCHFRTVDATCANVPNPVLLSRVDRIKGHKSAETPPLARVDVEVAQTVMVVTGRQGDYQVTTTTTKKDGANKASFAVMAATQGKKDLDVHVTRAAAGAWVLAPLAFVRTKSWVGVEGDTASAGGR